MKKWNLKNQPAFTLPETLLSIILLTVGLLVVLTYFATAHRHAVETRSAIIAANLAQEGVEVVRNIRDTNEMHRFRDWTTGDNCSTSTNGDCDPFRGFPNNVNQRKTVNYNSTVFTNPGQTWLTLNASNFYTHGAGATTLFYRVIRVDVAGAGVDQTARVYSFATWQDPFSNLNGPIGDAVDWCTLDNKCIYTQLLLTVYR